MTNQIDRLLDRLKSKHLRKADFARLLGITPQVLNSWFSRGKIPGNMLFKVSKTLDCSVTWLATGEGSPDQAPGVSEPTAPYVVTQDMIMQQALEIADGVEARLGIKVNSDEKWSFIQNVAILLREKYTRDNIPLNTAEIIDIAEILERARRGMGKKDNNDESATR